MSFYLEIFIITLLLAVALTFFILRLAAKFNILDKPDSVRKFHSGNVPLMGGLAIFFSFFLVLFYHHNFLLTGNLRLSHWLGFFIGACWLMIGGFLDDKYDLKPTWQFIFPALAIASVIAGGVQIEKITNPLGGYIYLGSASAVLISFWLLGMIYTTKFLDGLDGLVAGVTVIGSLIIFAVSLYWDVPSSGTSVLALILAGACFGFLFFKEVLTFSTFIGGLFIICAAALPNIKMSK